MTVHVASYMTIAFSGPVKIILPETFFITLYNHQMKKKKGKKRNVYLEQKQTTKINQIIKTAWVRAGAQNNTLKS